MILLQSLIDGDGTLYKNKTSAIFYGKEKMVDNIQALCSIYGYKAGKSVFRTNDFRINISKRDSTEFKSKCFEKSSFSGKVYSVYGNGLPILSRRFGTTCFIPTHKI